MSDNNAWLDEMGNSPYARQLGTGFAFLRFSRPLETRFRRFSLLQNRRLRLTFIYETGTGGYHAVRGTLGSSWQF